MARIRREESSLITEGYLAHHYRGRSGGRDYALLDVAQDYALKVLSDAGLFDLGLIFKGGTALRKFRAGNLGRFSTDLDFASSDRALGDLVLETLDGSVLFDVAFRTIAVTAGQRGQLSISTPLGSPGIDALLEISPRQPWLPPFRRRGWAPAPRRAIPERPLCSAPWASPGRAGNSAPCPAPWPAARQADRR